MENEKNVTAVVKEPNKDARVSEISTSLESFQKLVEGCIEIVPFPGIDEVDIVLNEEGKLINMKPNVLLEEYNDVAVGQIVVIGFDEEAGEHRSLTKEEIDYTKKYLKEKDARNCIEDIKDIEEYLGIIFIPISEGKKEKTPIDKYVERTLKSMEGNDGQDKGKASSRDNQK